MDIVPHIDIMEEDHIAELLDNPDNYVFDAYACETLDGWVPDIGLTNYRKRSIFRPPVLAKSGLATTLSHRFWETRVGTADHTGKRWVGILLYASAREECPLELMLGAEEIGRIEPKRHDNRRHLIVVDRCVTFRGGMEVFRLIAPGKGIYRIEKFALLRTRPEPSSFAPCIRRLSAKRMARDANTVQIHFITSQAARAHIRVVPNGNGRGELAVETEEFHKLHVVEMRGLRSDISNVFTVTATEPEGESSSRKIVLAGKTSKAKGEAFSIPVEIFNMSGVDASGMPLCFGIPVPKGKLRLPAQTILRINGSESTTQARIHSSWPDGSARWVLVDTTCPSSIGPSSKSEGKIVIDPQEPAQDHGLICDIKPGSIVVESDSYRVTVNRGLLPCRIERRAHKGGWEGLVDGKLPAEASKIVLGNGVRLKPGDVQDLTLEEAGCERSVILYRLPYEDSEGATHFLSTIRLHIYQSQPFIRIVHRLEVVSPLLAPATGGRIEDCPEGFDEIRSAIAGKKGEEATLITVCSMALKIAYRGSKHVSLNGSEYRVSADNPWRLTHEHDQAHSIEAEGKTTMVAGRTKGSVRVNGEKGALAFGLRNFWETYPKAISVTGDAVTLEFLPVLSGEDLPGDDDAWHRLYSWYDAGKYKLKAGMALTSEALLAFPDNSENASRLISWFENPPLVRTSLSWLNETNALSPLGNKKGSSVPRYEDMMDGAYDGWMEERESFRQYGFLNFGDWYGESDWSWGNNEYDPPYAHYCEFLRGGKPEWAVLARQAVRHLTDVDTCNHSVDPRQIGGQYGHMPGHAGGYLPPYFRSKVGSSCMFASHMWIEGASIHYSLTGDEGVRESIEKTADWLLSGSSWGTVAGSVVVDMEGLDNYDYGQLRTIGWHIIHLCGLARWTDDPRYLNAAAILVGQVLERQDQEGGWVRLLRWGHCNCYPPRHEGEATFMVGVLLSGLRRYFELTGDEGVKKAITKGAQWLIQNTYDTAKKTFRTSSCPNSLSGGASTVQQVIEGLAFAHALSPNLETARVLEDTRSCIGQPKKATSPDERNAERGIGSRLTHETRYVPTYLAYWQPGSTGRQPSE